MSQLREKDSKNEIVVAETGGESPAGLRDRTKEGVDGQEYTEPNKTWKSFFWSSERPTTSN